MIYLGYKTVDETTDAANFTNRSTFTDEKEVKVAKIFFNLTTWYIEKGCNVNTITISNGNLMKRKL